MNRQRILFWVILLGILLFGQYITLAKGVDGIDNDSIKKQPQSEDFLVENDPLSKDGKEKQYLIDEFGVFDDFTHKELNEQLHQLVIEKDMDLVVVFVRGYENQLNHMKYQKLGIQFIEKYDYGTGTDHTVGLMIVDMKNRWIQLVGHGRLEEILDSNSIREEIIDKVGKALRRNDYDVAVKSYVDIMIKSYEYYNRTIVERFIFGLFSIKGIVLAFVISLIIIMVMIGRHNQIKKGTAVDYEVKGSYNLIQKIDNFTHSSVSSRTISKKTHSSSSSSSSGGGYSGGGGSF